MLWTFTLIGAFMLGLIAATRYREVEQAKRRFALTYWCTGTQGEAWAYLFLHSQWSLTFVQQTATEVIPCGGCDRAIRIGEDYWYRTDELEELDGPAFMFGINPTEPALCNQCAALEDRPSNDRTRAEALTWERRFWPRVVDAQRKAHRVLRADEVRRIAKEINEAKDEFGS